MRSSGVGIEADQAINAAKHLFADADGGDHLRATSRGEDLWSVAAVSVRGMVEPGALVLVGPDLRVWAFSSNPGIHDSDTVLIALSGIYAAGVADQVDGEGLAARIASATSAIHEQRRSIVADAKAGALRAAQPRRLP